MSGTAMIALRHRLRALTLSLDLPIARVASSCVSAVLASDGACLQGGWTTISLWLLCVAAKTTYRRLGARSGYPRRFLNSRGWTC